MIKTCKHCSVKLNENNASKKNALYWRNECKNCRSKQVVSWQKKNKSKRKEYVNEYVRKIGKVKQYECLTCKKLCYKVYAHAYCTVKCRFISYIKKLEDCWIWSGGRSSKGYGKFMMNNKLEVASRASYILFKGLIEDGKFICHTCDNPPCVNPDHLWQGTNSENQFDSIKKGRRKYKNVIQSQHSAAQ